MKTYVAVRYPPKSPLPCSVYFNSKRFDIKEHISSDFINGVTILKVRIGNKETRLYREEISKLRRWYVSTSK